jgi:predicted small lipoprotein YifL
MKNRVKLTGLAAFLMLAPLLAACGKMGDLEPRAGVNKVPVAYGASAPAGATELSTSSAQARPGRSVELLTRSYRRGEDPFDLPPGVEPKTGEIAPSGDTAPPKKQ